MSNSPLTPIPIDKVPEMLNKKVHVSTADNGCVWYLRQIIGDVCILETPKTRKKKLVDIKNLCYLRKDENEINSKMP